MALILCIETSATICSVALARDGDVIADLHEEKVNSHAAILTVLIERLMKASSFDMAQLDALAVSGGPGSYTGLRIGVSTAKGICFALTKPLIALKTLEIMAFKAIKTARDTYDGESLFCPMIDARRMEVYAAFYDTSLNLVREIEAEIIDGQSYLDILRQYPVYFFGNGSAKCRDAITNPNAHFLPDINPYAKDMAVLSYTKFINGDFEDVAYYEPFYLKEFIAITPRNKYF